MSVRRTDIRQQARESGNQRYQGSPCPHGHAGIRYSSNGRCVDCAKAEYQLKPYVRAEAIRIRRKAQTDGKLKYQGTPCKHGHQGIRYTSNGMCVDCAARLNVKTSLAKMAQDVSEPHTPS